MIKNMLKMKETPIILGLLLSFIPWGITRIVGKYSDFPVIEYYSEIISQDQLNKIVALEHKQMKECSKEKQKSKNNYYLKINFQNISNIYLLKNVNIAFDTDQNSDLKFLRAYLLSEAPAIKGNTTETCHSNSIQLSNLTFHPKWEFELIVFLNENSKFKPLLTFQSKDQAVYLKEKSWFTKLIKYETNILIWSLSVAAICVFLYLRNFFYSKEVDNAK